MGTGVKRQAQLDAYKTLKEKLGGSGASAAVAKLILERTHA